MTQGPRDIFHGLSCLLASLSGGQSKPLNLLQGKVAASTIPFQSIPRFLEIKEDTVSSCASGELSSATSPVGPELPFHGTDFPRAQNSMPIQLKRQDSDKSVSSIWTEQVSPPLYNVESFIPPTFSVTNAGLINDSGLIWGPHMTHV